MSHAMDECYHPGHGKGAPAAYPRICQMAEDCQDVTWKNYQWQILWCPIIIQAVWSWVCYLLTTFLTGATPTHVAIDAGGTLAKHSKRRTLHIVLLVLDLIASLIFVCIWVRRSYTRRVEPDERKIEMVVSVLLVFQYISAVVNSRFRVTTVWQPMMLSTTMSVVPVLVAPSAVDATWMNWAYLRVLNAAQVYEQLDDMWDINAVIRRALVGIVRTVALLVAFGGTVMLLEIYGDPQYLEDMNKVIATDMGMINVYDTLYFVLSTLSTVGYGDYVPTTTLGKLFLTVAILGGLAFFISEAEQLARMRATLPQGTGKYSQPNPDIKHIVVVGGEVSNPGSLLRAFNQELFADRYVAPTTLAGTVGKGWPTCAYMAQRGYNKLCAMHNEAPRHVKILSQTFVGNSLRRQDLERVDVRGSALTLALADADAEDKLEEDHNTLIQALALARFYPLTKFILWVTLPQSKVKALRMGFDPQRCLSLYELKCSIMAQSLLVKGWSTMLTSLLFSTSVEGEDLAITKKCIHLNKPFEEFQWLREYRYGSHMTFCRFHVHDKFVGTKFQELAKHAANVTVIVVGAVINGKLMLNPYQHVLRANDVIYGITPMEGNLHTLRKTDFDLDEESITSSMTRPADHIWKIRDSADTCFQASTATPINSQLSEVVHNALQKGKELSQVGGHYVLVLLDNYAWQQAYVFLKAVQSDVLPTPPPVVVLAPPPGPCDEVAEVIFRPDTLNRGLVVGNPSMDKDVEEVCLDKAMAVAMIAGKQSAEGDRMTDSPGILALTTMEGVFARKRVQGVPILLELFNENSVRLCPRLPKCIKPYLPPQSRHVVEGSDDSIGEPYHDAPRFAGGGIFVASCLGGVIAQSYYMEGITELVQALSLGHQAGDGSAGSGQTSFPWQIKLPDEFRDPARPNRTYSELVEYLCSPPWNAICIGLYRQRFEGVHASACYTALNPPQKTILRTTDLVTVLGDRAFSCECAKRGLLLVPA